MKSFWDFPLEVRSALIMFSMEGPSEFEGEGFVLKFEPCATRPGKPIKNAFKLALEVDVTVWEPPAHGKTMAIKFQTVAVDTPSKATVVRESVHRLKKTVRRDNKGNVTELTFRTHFTPGANAVHLSPLSELWNTHSEGVRSRRMREQAGRHATAVRPYEMALVR